MPIFEYECEKCRKRREVLTKSPAPPYIGCECGGRMLRLVSLGNFVLKGDGWFKDGYAKKVSNENIESD